VGDAHCRQHAQIQALYVAAPARRACAR
jgi:hypothetical protein